MAATFTKIATVTVSGTTTSSIEFTSIPSGYSDICVLISARTDRASATEDDLAVQINSDGTAGRHSWKLLYTNSSTVSSAGNSSDSYGHGGWVPASSATSNTFGNVLVYIPNYTSSNQKSFSVDSVCENNASTDYLALGAGLYNQTTAVTSLKFFSRTTSTNKFIANSTATLYGIINS